MHHLKPRYPAWEAFALIGVPRSTGYLAVKSGRLKIQKDGRRSFVTADEIDRYVREECSEVAPILDTPARRRRHS